MPCCCFSELIEIFHTNSFTVQRHVIEIASSPINHFSYLQVHLKIKSKDCTSLFPFQNLQILNCPKKKGTKKESQNKWPFLNLIELLLFTANIVVNVKDGAARCRSIFAHLKARLPFGTPCIRGVEMKM